MTVAAVIAEYNPFHKGHQYHLAETRKQSGAKSILVVMSGNFVQRGDAAIINKYKRAACAVTHGADLVLEMPTAYASQSAEIFSRGAVGLLHQLNIVDVLSFGSESADDTALRTIARALLEETAPYKASLRSQLNDGLPYAAARSKALANTSGSGAELGPNDILAVEYLRQLALLCSTIKPLIIPRISSAYHDPSLDSAFVSATAIRLHAQSMSAQQIEHLLPVTSAKILLQERRQGRLMDLEKYFPEIRLLLLRSKEDLKKIFEIKEGLENRLFQSALTASSVEELLKMTKSKRYSYTRLRRILVNVLLKIERSDMSSLLSQAQVPYGRVLAFNDTGRQLLKRIKQEGYPLITKEAHFRPTNLQSSSCFQLDLRANAIYYSKCEEAKKTEFQHSPIYVGTQKGYESPEGMF